MLYWYTSLLTGIAQELSWARSTRIFIGAAQLCVHSVKPLPFQILAHTRIVGERTHGTYEVSKNGCVELQVTPD